MCVCSFCARPCVISIGPFCCFLASGYYFGQLRFNGQTSGTETITISTRIRRNHIAHSNSIFPHYIWVLCSAQTHTHRRPHVVSDIYISKPIILSYAYCTQASTCEIANSTQTHTKQDTHTHNLIVPITDPDTPHKMRGERCMPASTLDLIQFYHQLMGLHNLNIN